MDDHDENENEIPSIVTFSEDVSDAEAPPLLPKGKYPGQIKSAERAVGTSSGKPYALLYVHINPDAFPVDFDGADAYPDGVTLPYRRIGLSDDRGTRYRVRKACERMGVEPPGRTLDLNAWVGHDVTVVVEHTKYEGEDRMEVRELLEG